MCILLLFFSTVHDILSAFCHASYPPQLEASLPFTLESWSIMVKLSSHLDDDDVSLGARCVAAVIAMQRRSRTRSAQWPCARTMDTSRSSCGSSASRNTHCTRTSPATGRTSAWRTSSASSGSPSSLCRTWTCPSRPSQPCSGTSSSPSARGCARCDSRQRRGPGTPLLVLLRTPKPAERGERRRRVDISFFPNCLWRRARQVRAAPADRHASQPRSCASIFQLLFFVGCDSYVGYTYIELRLWGTGEREEGKLAGII
jgi:hypothetical protein